MRVGERFITAPIPSLGHHYLEFEQLPLASSEELIGMSSVLFLWHYHLMSFKVTFILMEVLRQSRFNLHTDLSERSKLWWNTPLANWGRRLRRRSI